MTDVMCRSAVDQALVFLVPENKVLATE